MDLHWLSHKIAYKVDTLTILMMIYLYDCEHKLYENNIHIMSIKAKYAEEKGTKIDIGWILVIYLYLEMLQQVCGSHAHIPR